MSRPEREDLRPFQAERDGPFAAAEVAHLFRRAGFGAPQEELLAHAERGLPSVLDQLFARDEGRGAKEALSLASSVAEWNDLPSLQALWLLRMLTTKSQAAEKLALFWHGHFATSYTKVQSAELMWRQYLLFRERGPGPFREMLLAVAKDPAMLLWLDGNSNHRNHPNENFARELMELFALGIGQYSENDIREVARSFSGWHIRNGSFWFNQRAHDDGVKTIFERRGPFGGEDVIRLCLDKDCCARFLAKKLLRFYLRPNPPQAWVTEIAAWLREEDYVVEAVLRRLFSSRAFFAKSSRRATIKSPVELVIGTLRALKSRADFKSLAILLRDMGQELFAPPSVQGWVGHNSWISSHSLLARHRFAAAVAFQRAQVEWKWRGLPDRPKELVEVAIQKIHQGPLTPEAQAAMVALAQKEKGSKPLHTVLHMLVASPEFQLN